MPEGTRRDQFLAWIDGLPDKQSPDWLGLPTNAETVLLTNLGKNWNELWILKRFIQVLFKFILYLLILLVMYLVI